jgi:hypothetical protein
MLPFLLNTHMDIWTLATLIDITPTGVTKGNSIERLQQTNWETVTKTLGLRTQAEIFDETKIFEEFNITKVFGDFYGKKQKIWVINFISDREDIYSVEQLMADFNNLPIVLGLDETARFLLPVFIASGPLKNVTFVKTTRID